MVDHTTQLTQVLPFWERLAASQRSLLTDNTMEIRYFKGMIVSSTENECIGVLTIIEGGLRVLMRSPDGREITLYRLKPGDVCILSASCLLHNITFDVTIEAEEDTLSLRTGIAAWQHLQNESLYVENFSLRLAVSRFSDVMWAMEQLLFSRLDRRIAAFLFDESTKTGSDCVNLTHERIASYVGSAREAVSRMLKQFEAEGFVALQRGGVAIINRESLRKLLQ